jgi:4-nitrophenyl phosphatase
VTGVTDVSDEAVEQLRNARGFIFDMDGTLVLGDRANHGLRALPGAISMLDWVRSRGLPYVVFTNGTNRTPAHFARVLRDEGLDVPDELMMTPASSAVVMFAKRGFRRVMVLGVSGLIDPLRGAGIEVVRPAAAAVPPVDAVFVGWFREFTMDHLEAACHAVWAGAELYSASETPRRAAGRSARRGRSRR